MQLLLLVSFLLAIAWNWNGFKDTSRSSWGTPGYVFALYGTIFCTVLIFVVLKYLTNHLLLLF